MNIDIPVPKPPSKGPKWLRKIFADLIDFSVRSRVFDIDGAAVNQTPKGLSVGISSPGAGANAIWPFQVLFVPNLHGTGGGLGVNPDSHVINGADKDAYEEDNSDWGLLNDDYKTDGITSGGIGINSLNLGDKIWLKFTFDSSQNLTSIDLKHGPVGSSEWDEFPDPIAINKDDPSNPFQEFYHQIIAEVTNPAEDPRPGLQIKQSGGSTIQITQLLFTNLILTPAVTTSDADQANLGIMVAIPWNGPATNSSGSADEINDQTDVKTPWQFGKKDAQIDFQLSAVPQSGGAADKLGIFSGTVSDSGASGTVHNVTGLTTGEVTAVDVSGSGQAWLVITYTEDLPPNITSVTFDTGGSVPDNESGTLYVPLGGYWFSGTKLYANGAIGSQVFEAWRLWFSFPVKYAAECGPV